MSTPTSTYTCPYCRIPSDGSGGTCPHCGAPVDVRERVTDSGWAEQPAIRDMARIRFSRSTCQIVGKYVPVAEMSLHDDDWVYFSHHSLLHTDPQVRLDTMRMAGGWNRMLAGMPLIMMTARGPGHIAFSADRPGETLAVPLQHNQAVDVVEHLPSGLPHVTPPRLDPHLLMALAPGALSIVLVGYAEALGAAKAAASGGDTIDANQELTAHGVANALSGLFGGFLAVGSLSKTSVAIGAGARTQVSNGLAARMVFYHYDFVDGTSQLNTRGRDKLAPIPIIDPQAMYLRVCCADSDAANTDQLLRGAGAVGIQRSTVS